MKIILAGMPKTGTKSIKEALSMLGYSVYDAEENFTYLYDEWTKIMTIGGEVEDFKKMYTDIDATCDVPACYFWEEMHQAFPDAKIVLMVRDNEDDWYTSMHKQLETLANCSLYSIISRLSPHCTRLQAFLNNGIRVAFGSVPISTWHTYTPNEQTLRIAYRNHNARVMQVAPKDKLLVYKCSEGWPKLCEFLGCQVPDETFPHKNKRSKIIEEDMKQNKPGYRQIKREITMSLCAIISIVGYFIFQFANSSILFF